ncbi:MAG: 30S ribosomal protein S9 [Desulfosudaceae bacterium]
MEDNRTYATGKRKSSIAKIWMKPGSGVFTVNGKEYEAYFTTSSAQTIAREALKHTGLTDSYDITIAVKGGGITGQAGATCHAISKALIQISPELRQPLKSSGFLRRDARCKERKKYGQRGARARYQYSKR